jgi:hypothetical protein
MITSTTNDEKDNFSRMMNLPTGQTVKNVVRVPPAPDSISEALRKNEEIKICLSRQGTDSMLIELPQTGLFRVCDVRGDGNCFFNALVLSPQITIKCPAELRNLVVKMLEENPEAKRLYFEIVKTNQPYDSWVDYVRRPGTWVGSDVSIFVCMMLDINLCLVTNGKNGFNDFDVRKWLILQGEYFVVESAPTIYLYHHLYKYPFQRSDCCNHFALLYPFEGSRIKGFNIYQNEPDEEQRTGTIINVDNSNPPDAASTDTSPRSATVAFTDGNTGTFTATAVAAGVAPIDSSMVSSMKKRKHDLQKTKDGKRHRSNDASQKMMKSDAKSKKEAARKSMECRKQMVMQNYLMSMKPSTKSIEQLNDRKRSIKEFQELEIHCEVQCVLMSMVDHVSKSAETTCRSILLWGGRKSHLTWQARALIIAFWVHPFLGDKDYLRTGMLFDVNHNTLRTWIFQAAFLPLWLPFVKGLCFEDVLNSIPKPYKEIYDKVPLEKRSYDNLYNKFRSKASQKTMVLCHDPRDNNASTRLKISQAS